VIQKFTLKLTLGELRVGTLSVRLGKQDFKHKGAVRLAAGESVAF